MTNSSEQSSLLSTLDGVIDSSFAIMEKIVVNLTVSIRERKVPSKPVQAGRKIRAGEMQ